MKATTQPDLDEVVSRFSGRRVLVVGDVMLDEYIWGTVGRMSPEAPVPIVNMEERIDVPGGAGNTAANAASLGAQVQVIGVVGADDAGQRLACALSRQGVRVSELVVDPDRPTTVKTRIMAQNRQLLRRDHEDCRRPPVPVIMKVLHAIDRLLPQVDACILSDYAKGLVFPPVARRLIGSATALSKKKGSGFVSDEKL